MRLFINNKRIRFVEKMTLAIEDTFTKVIDDRGGKPELRFLKGNLLFKNPSPEYLKELLNILDSKKLPELESATFLVNNTEISKNLVKSHFKIIKAAGGLVVKDQKILLIHRLGIWDLPKGKLEKGEDIKFCALREVAEECGVKAELVEKLCSTWHSYNSKGNNILKKTKWYLMQCTDDSQMGPQQEEGIDKVEWKTVEEADLLLKDSYLSIQEVYHAFLKLRSRKVAG